jgi:hypothetical protein
MTELDQDFEPLAGGPLDRIDGAHRRGRGSRTVTEAVDHTEQSGFVVDANGDLSIPAGVLTR